MENEESKEPLGNSVLPEGFAENIKSAVDAATPEPEKDESGVEDKPESQETPEEKVDVDSSEEEDDQELPSDKGDEPKSKDEDSPVAEDDDDDDPDGDDGIDDELLTAAVKAGLSISEAKQFGNSGLLKSMIQKLTGGEEADGEENADDESSMVSAIDSIPDLDPEEYDESIVGTFKAMKDLLKNQSSQLAALSQSKSATWMEEQINTLGDVAKDVRGDPTKKKALTKRFEVLKAGYNAVNESKTEEEIFQEAASIELAGEMSKAKSEAKSKAAKKRSGQKISRPGAKNAVPKKSVEEETAQMLKEKFNL